MHQRSEEVILRNKTKQILLEYFSLIPEEKPNMIDITNRIERPDNNSEEKKETGKVDVSNPFSELHPPEKNEEITGKEKADKKYHTMTVAQDDFDNLMKQLAAHTKNENGKVVARSKSFESTKYYLTMREKMQQLLHPIVTDNDLDEDEKDSSCNRNLSTNSDNNLKCKKCCIENRPSISSVPSSSKCKKLESRKHLRLAIPDHVLKHGDTKVVSANTYAVNLLEEISQDIMSNYPNIFNEAIQELLTPLHVKKEIPYELFSTVVKPVFSLQLKGAITNIWHNISLVMALIKETMIVGNFDDEMMEIMVDHSTKFFMENVVESVEEEGGWEILNVRNEPSCQCETLGETSTQCENSKCLRTYQQVQGKVYDWLPVIVALFTVGVGLAYNFR